MTARTNYHKYSPKIRPHTLSNYQIFQSFHAFLIM